MTTCKTGRNIKKWLSECRGTSINFREYSAESDWTPVMALLATGIDARPFVLGTRYVVSLSGFATPGRVTARILASAFLNSGMRAL